MSCERKKNDSNSTGLFYAEELCLGQLPSGTPEMLFNPYSEESGPPGTAFPPGSGPPLSGMALAFNASTEYLTIDMVTRAVLTEFYVRISHIRGGITIATNVGAYVSQVDGDFTGSASAGHARKFDGGPINTVQNVQLVMNLSAVVFQQGDELLVEVSRASGYTYRSYRTTFYQSTDGSIWRQLEPNSYDDFGGNIDTVARNPINPSRQRKKGVVVDLDSTGGFNTDLTQSGLTRLMQGFCFANAREKVSTESLQGSVLTIVAVTAADGIEFANSGETAFRVGNIIKTTNFGVSGNNGIFTVTAIAGGKVDTSPALVDEASPPDNARVEVVGQVFATADLSIDVNGAECRINSAADDFTLYKLNVGEWIFVGGDATANHFNNNQGFGRIASIAESRLVLEEVTWTAVDEAGTGKDIQLWWGTFIRNEKEQNLIRQKSYQLERQLGYDDNGIQSEILTGAVPNEFTLNLEAAKKIECDLSFVGLDVELREGTDGLKSGARISALAEDAFNCATDVYQMRLFVIDPATLSPTSLFGFVKTGKLKINNNIGGLKAIGTLGSFDINVGDFEVGGELECYFDTIEAVRAVRQNDDVGFNAIISSQNGGMVYDIPLLSLGGGRNDVKKDEPIMLPLDTAGAENANGYTFSQTIFSYLPDLAMAE